MKILRQKARYVLASRNLFDYCSIRDSDTFYNEENAPYLKEICDAIQEFEYDDNEAIIINEPPRHRKDKNNKRLYTMVIRKKS